MQKHAVEFIPLHWIELSYWAFCHGEQLEVYSRPVEIERRELDRRQQDRRQTEQHTADGRRTEENKRIEQMLRSVLLPATTPAPEYFISLEV